MKTTLSLLWMITTLVARIVWVIFLLTPPGWLIAILFSDTRKAGEDFWK